MLGEGDACLSARAFPPVELAQREHKSSPWASPTCRVLTLSVHSMQGNEQQLVLNSVVLE